MPNAENLRELAQDRWNNCAIIGRHLGLSKVNVHNYLYATIKHLNLLELALVGEVNTLQRIRSLEAYERMERQLEGEGRSTLRHPKNETLETPEEKLRVAMWFIRKVGSAEEAIKVIKAATLALNKLDEQS